MQFIIANNGMYINDTQDDIYRLLAISRFQYFYKVITKVFDNLHLHTCVTAPISVLHCSLHNLLLWEMNPSCSNLFLHAI